jgi:hypothetical protein
MIIIEPLLCWRSNAEGLWTQLKNCRTTRTRLLRLSLNGYRRERVVFFRQEGGTAKFLAKYCIVSLSTATRAIQKIQIVLTHPLYECVEVAMVAV